MLVLVGVYLYVQSTDPYAVVESSDLRFMHNLLTSGLAILLFVFAGDAHAQSVVGVLGIATEIAPIEQRLQDSRDVVVRGYVFRVGTLDGHPVVVGRSGIGKVNAAIVTTLLIEEFTPDVVFFTGTAGAIDPALRPGDVVIGASVVQHDFGRQTAAGLVRSGARNGVTGDPDPVIVPAPPPLLSAARRSAQHVHLPTLRNDTGEERAPHIVEGVIATGDVFVLDPTLRDTLRRTLDASAVEMEGAAVVQTCRQFSVSCLIVRGITDRADGQAQVSYTQFIAIASANAAALVTAIVGDIVK
jgi:adenosylhomocysteine nucleosidase